MKKIIFTVLLSLTQVSIAASFDCSQAKSPSEIAICADEKLSKLDEQVAAAYSSLISKINDKTQLESEQNNWLAKRDACGNQTECLASNMENRIGELNQQEASLTAVTTTSATKSTKEESSWITALVVWALIIGGIAWVVMKVIRFYKNMKFRSMVKKNYESVSQIGSFVDSSKYVTAHGAVVGKKSSRAEVIEYLPARLHISKPFTTNSGTWTADIGYFDAASFNNAMMHYQTAYQQWKIGKAQFDQQEEMARKRAEQMKQIYSRNYYNVSEPSKPRKNDYITYTPHSGECSANVQHGYIVTSGNTEFPSEKCGSFVVDIDKIQNNITSIYKGLLDRIYAGQVSIDIDANAIAFYNIDEQSTYDKISKEVGNALLADAKRYMGEYHKNLAVPRFTGNTERNEIELPVAIVVAKMPDGKLKYTIHDHLFPEIVLS